MEKRPYIDKVTGFQMYALIVNVNNKPLKVKHPGRDKDHAAHEVYNTLKGIYGETNVEVLASIAIDLIN